MLLVLLAVGTGTCVTVVVATAVEEEDDEAGTGFVGARTGVNAELLSSSSNELWLTEWLSPPAYDDADDSLTTEDSEHGEMERRTWWLTVIGPFELEGWEASGCG